MAMQLSRSEQKRRIRELEKLVVELSSMPAPVLARLPCAPEIVELLQETGSMKGGARKRQIKYITKLLRKEPVESLYAFVSKRHGAALQEKKDFHELEYLRDALLNEALEQRKRCQELETDREEDWSSQVIGEISSQFPGIDTRTLARLAWLFARTRSRKHGREIFRLLRAAREQKTEDR